MSDRIYDTSSQNAIDNFVTIAQAASPRFILTKRNYVNGLQDSYDRVKHFNFTQRQIESLDNLYMLCRELLEDPRRCIIRAQIKDNTKDCKHAIRKCVGPDATLVVQEQNWFCIDIDGLDGYTGDLLSDLNTVLLALPPAFRTECFAVASASYGFFKKPGIHMKVFYWSWQPVSGSDLKRALAGNQAKADVAIFNPIQLIYIAKPFWVGCDDPIKERMVYYNRPENAFVNIPIYSRHYQGAPEQTYTKRQSIGVIVRSFERIAELTYGNRHNGLIREGFLGGHLCYQGFLDEDDALERLEIATSYWTGTPPNPEKDREAYLYGFKQGIQQMEDKENDI
jgi:hypothetical protein